MPVKKNFYAVRVGHVPGIYSTWAECQAQTNGYRSASFKGFATRAEAESFMRGDDSTTNTTPLSSASASTSTYGKVEKARNKPRYNPVAPPSLDFQLHSAVRMIPTSQQDAEEKEYIQTIQSIHNRNKGAEPTLPCHNGDNNNSNRERKYMLLKTDGAAKSNPNGHSGCGGVLWDEHGNRVDSFCKYLGKGPNNEAEYHGFVQGMKKALELGVTDLKVQMDSNLIVKQMTGLWDVKAANLLPLYKQANDLKTQFRSFQLEHVYREMNKEADAMANKAIDDHLSSRA